MRQWLTIFLLIFLGGWSAQGQLLTPLNSAPPHVAGGKGPGRSDLTPQPLDGETLVLPFFDDFASGEGGPDPRRWLPGGNVNVTNRLAVNPPTIFAATFDGLQANGQPYGSANTTGPTDTLTSKAIALSSFQPEDSLYLSFYWQAGGLVDAPDFSGSMLYYLQLEFRDASGTWSPVWSQKGAGRSTNFAPVMVALKESRYFYDGFQFRWVSSGSRNGLRDVWHLDYVYLDRNRRLGQLQTTDAAFTQRLPSLLRRYTAMPIWQFLENPGNEVRSEVGASFNNLSNLPAAISWRAYSRNQTTAAVDTFLRGSAPVSAGASQSVAGSPSVPFLSRHTQPHVLETVLFLNTREPNFYTRYNDTLRRETSLQDFYAYDDGSAETGFSFPSSNAVQLAYQFELSKPDRIKTVRIYFTGTNTPGTELFLRLWADDNGQPARQPLLEQLFTVPQTAGLNNWLDIVLERQVEVQGRFFVGYRQPTGGTFVNVGFDLNENANGKLFAMNGTAAWQAVPDLGGAVLIRPVMAGTLTAVEQESLTQAKPLLYPNPTTSGSFYMQQGYDQVELYSPQGQLLQVWGKVPPSQALQVQASLPAGIYLVKARKGDQLRTAKLILLK
ncbi:T9SS type A sorting domain-containing protein [Rufibacter immobilis]|uniref:T9SS type A sorting domain-containing protein n=1 Tax=Rufibacter immobilis TaxID=1348778 RepID=UPI0035E7B7EC